MSDDPSSTPKRGLTAVIREEIGVKTHVQLGFVLTCLGAIVGGILWMSSIKADASSALEKIGEIKKQRDEDRREVGKQLDKMDAKIDKILDELRKGSKP